MQTVATSLQLFDNFSKVLSQIDRALVITSKHMGSLKSSLGDNISVNIETNKANHQLNNLMSEYSKLENSINKQDMTAPLKAVERQTKATEQATENYRKSTERLRDSKGRFISTQTKVEANQRRINNLFRRGSSDAESFTHTLKNVVGTYLSIAAAQSLLSTTLGGAMEQTSYLDTLTARSGSEGLGQAIYNEITKQALKAGQDVNDALSGTMSFMANTMDPTQLKELNKLSMRLSKLNPMEGLEGAAFSMKELLSGDYTSIVERFNIGRGTIQKSDALAAGKAGDIEGFITGMDKLLTQQNLSEAAFERMLDSPAAKWNKILNTFKFNIQSTGIEALSAFEPLFDAINKGFDSGQFAQVFGSISAGLTMLANLSAIVFQFLLDNFDVVKNTLLVVGVVAAVVATNFIIGWIAAAWPIVLISAAIIGLLSVLNVFGISTGEVIGYVIATFYSLYASIHNNIGLAWNLILSFAEFLVNIFIDPIYAIKKLFYDMFNSVADYFTTLINDIIDGLNWVVNAINSVVGTSINVMGHVSGDGGPEKPTTDANVIDLSKYKMEQLSRTEAYSKGMAAGTKFTKGLSNFTAGAGAGTVQDYKVPTGSAIKTPDVGKVGKVGQVDKIKDTVDISSEDLKVMRDLAEMKAIQNFVTLTPTVQVKTGNIMQTVDVEDMIEQIADAMEKEIASSAKGVYE